jgi:TonB family protein
LLVNAALTGLVLFAGSFKPVQQTMNEVVTLVAPSSILPKPAENKAGGGGGGGRRIVSKAAPPRAIRQFISPVTPAVQAKLQAPILLSAMPPDIDVPADASNLSGLLAAAGGGYGRGIGTGMGSGIGSGSGGGIGNGIGNGAGSGSGGQVYRPGGGVTNPVPIYSPEAEYPREARKAGLQGSVLLALVVDPSGRAVDIQVIRTLGMGLEGAARDAVSKWRFKPGTKDGKPVPVLVQVEVTFRLL